MRYKQQNRHYKTDQRTEKTYKQRRFDIFFGSFRRQASIFDLLIIRQKLAAASAVSVFFLFVFSATWTKHLLFLVFNLINRTNSARIVFRRFAFGDHAVFPHI